MFKIDISTKNISLDGPLRIFVEDKIGGLEKFLAGHSDISARVEIGKPSQHHAKGPIFYAEVNLTVGGKLLRAEATHEDLRAAITKTKEELQVQIKKLKEKRSNR